MKKKRLSARAGKILMSIAAMVFVVGLLTVPAFAADADYAEKGAKWILSQIAWVVIAAGIAGAVFAGVKRNVTAAVTIVIIAAIGTVLCFNPDILVSIGNVLKGILGL